MLNLPSLFISYSRRYRHVAEHLASLLERILGPENVWFDKALTGGQEWWEELTRQIYQRDFLVYLLSKTSLESVYCRAELTEAWRKGKRVLPLAVSKYGNYPDVITRYQVLPLSDEVTVDEIVDILTSIIRTPPEIPFVDPASLWFNRELRPVHNSGIQVQMAVLASNEPSGNSLHRCNTGILLVPGDQVIVSASGEVSYNDRRDWVNPDGIHKLSLNDLRKNKILPYHSAYPVIIQEDAARNLMPGIVGTLFGWITDESSEKRLSRIG